MLRRNPLAALALHRPARPEPPSPAPGQQGAPADALPGGASDDEEATETAEARPAGARRTLPCPTDMQMTLLQRGLSMCTKCRSLPQNVQK